MKMEPVLNRIKFNSQKTMVPEIFFRLCQSIAVRPQLPHITIPPDFNPFILDDVPATPHITHCSVSMVNHGKLASKVRLFHVKTPLGFFQIGTSAKIPMGGRILQIQIPHDFEHDASFLRCPIVRQPAPAVNNLFFVGVCSAACKGCYNFLTASGEGSKGRPGCIIRG